ncbi:glycine N-acyltransferase-like protein 3 [Ostrea edulis]|uniref:glycine N-acyltransferase-like protein 3 n=1 Tax=Ostrea edulis TaxID=37623 RepID=UPI0024AE96FD|nr:glycine N-acyltransferase-like protein 3 [Ostrea edulis]XP_056022248.1 glycine N-acyltransferase-like protein 3 [Ostrea edulis]XP_056022249.1 glycine N-acyltransferase-like protein 3 [Ostrea edulis]XP_056022250.1 glycine N-acyltransferase-like protein 3 [Ostrea edulis]
MAVHELNSTEYATMETELEKELPYSICVFSHFKLLRRGWLTDKAVLVDSWPDFTAVVIVDSKRKKTLPYAVSFCKQPDSCQFLEILLRHAFEVLSSPLFITGCTDAVIDALVNRFKDAETSPVKKFSEGVAFTLPPDKIVPLEAPDGLRISKLKQSQVENVYNSWEYTEEYERHADLRYWIRYHISNFHTVCIETEDGRPVAWELQQEYGGIGMLYVEPEYRRANLGSVVTRTLAGKLVKDGESVFAFVEDSNETSINFHKKNGYVLMPFKASFAIYNL